jgi:hypothetical protein
MAPGLALQETKRVKTKGDRGVEIKVSVPVDYRLKKSPQTSQAPFKLSQLMTQRINKLTTFSRHLNLTNR